MGDGARIGLDRTAVPVELDRISQSLDDLLVALGPQGANEEGAFSRLLETGADNLEGQGQAIHDSNRDLSRALETLSGGRNDLFGTVKNLQSFTSMLATNDQQVRRLNKDLATVSTQLNGERDDLSAALKNLAIALNEVSTFVRDNRAGVKTNVAQPRLGHLHGRQAARRARRDADQRPRRGEQPPERLQPGTGTLDTRSNMEQFDDPALLLCSLVTGPTGTGNTDLCKDIDGLVSPLAGGLQGGSSVKLPLNLLSAAPGGTTCHGSGCRGDGSRRGPDPGRSAGGGR